MTSFTMISSLATIILLAFDTHLSVVQAFDSTAGKKTSLSIPTKLGPTNINAQQNLRRSGQQTPLRSGEIPRTNTTMSLTAGAKFASLIQGDSDESADEDADSEADSSECPELSSDEEKQKRKCTFFRRGMRIAGKTAEEYATIRDKRREDFAACLVGFLATGNFCVPKKGVSEIGKPDEEVDCDEEGVGGTKLEFKDDDGEYYNVLFCKNTASICPF